MSNTYPSDGLAFMKMHGLGNDFVIIDSRGRDAVVTEKLAAAMGHRNFGVGFDQLAEIRDGSDADIELDFWNSDGSIAEACGNATRCVAQLVMTELASKTISIRTLRGILQAEMLADGNVAVNMGVPELAWDEIPLSRSVDTNRLPLDGDPVGVGIGNPHCVFFVDSVSNVDVMAKGTEVQQNELFPESVNVEFAEVRGRDEVRMRVWERGAGATLACGSGACATAVAAHQRGLTDKLVRMELDGGWLTLDWREDGVWMSGPASHVFDARLSAEFLASI